MDAEPYIPKMNYVYPEQLDVHMMKIHVTHDRKVDENYPFFNKTPVFHFFRKIVYGIIFIILFPIDIIRFGLKIEGREILSKHKELFKNGAMTASNHIHRWDFIFILQALRYRRIYFPAWKRNFDTPDEPMVRLVGGIPIPGDIHTIKYFNRAFDEIHARKKWIHVFPEGSMFYFFYPIRPFKKGVFTMSYRYNLPVIPIGFSYRKPRFPFTVVNLIRTIFRFQKFPMITLRIGEPLLPDTSLPRKEAVQKLRKECHEAIIKLAGVIDNPYPAAND